MLRPLKVPLRRSVACGTLAVTALIGASSLGLGTAPATAATCSNAEFRVGPSLELPDCRAYEQVTSVNKRGNSLKTLFGTTLNPGHSSSDGNTLMYTPLQGPTTDNAARGYIFPEVATRTPDGWTTRPVSDGPAPQGVINTVSSFASYQIPDASRTKLLFMSGAPFAEDQPYIRTSANGGVYLARAGGSTDWLSRPTWVGSMPAQGEIDSTAWKFMPVGGSEDLATSYFMTRGTLTPVDDAIGRAPLTNWALYRSQDGQLSNAGVLPDGTVDPDGSVAAGISPGVGDSGGIHSNRVVAQWAYTNSVSDDGGLLFVSPDPRAGSTRPTQLYLRTGETTVELSKRPEEATAPVGSVGVQPTGGLLGNDTGSAGYVFAVSNPSHDVVIFSTQDALTDDAEGVDPAVVKTYRYKVDGQSLTYLPDLDRPAGGTKGMVYGLSPDGSRMLYRNTGDELRLWREGEPTLTLSSGVGPYSGTGSSGAGGISESRFSSDGRTVVLMSKVPLRGEPDHPVGGGAARTQIYRYTEADDQLECISCVPGYTLSAATFLMQGTDNGFGATGQSAPMASTRGMSEDGRIIFFTTAGALSPLDNNTAADVYRWKDGEVSLLSSGATGSFGEYLLDNSASGDDVFILSRRVLAPTDTDDVYDIYNVRVNGGFPPPAQAVVPCDGDACQNSIAAAPRSPSIGSSNFAGDGNISDTPRRARARVRVLRMKASNRGVARVRVRVPAAGRVLVNGAAIRRSAIAASKAGRYNVVVRLSPRAKKRLRAKGRLKVGARVLYRARGGQSASRKVAITFSHSKAKRANSKRGKK